MMWISNVVYRCTHYGERSDAAVEGCMRNELFVC